MDSQPNKLVFITGVSSGIGEALAKSLLVQNYLVIGIGRKCTIEHPNFSFQQVNLANVNVVKNFEFKTHAVQEIVLVNNAGIVGEIAPVGDLNADSIQEVVSTNLIAPQLLCNKFINTYLSIIPHLHIVNISSGAGKRPIDAWATYCSSKAALDLFSSTIQEEMTARKIENFYIHSVAPGIVDTNMQKHIRAASAQKFLVSQRFHDLKNNNELSSPKVVSERLFELIKNPRKTKSCVIALNEIVK